MSTNTAMKMNETEEVQMPDAEIRCATPTRMQVMMMEFKFGLIAPVLQETYTDDSETKYFRRITQKPIAFPNGKTLTLNYKTLQKWAGEYRKHGMYSLMPVYRSDRGGTRALDSDTIDRIYELKAKFPRINATQMYRQLCDEGFLDSKTGVSAVQRFVKNNDLKGASNPQMRDRKAFEMENFGDLWQADTCYITPIHVDEESRRLYAIGIIDDYSRYVVAAELFYHDNAYNFQKVLKKAILATCIPHKLLVDNGCSYSNDQLSMICVDCGIVLIHTRVRDGASKGKIERLWRSLHSQWEYVTDFSAIHSLEAANASFQEYIRKYNTQKHSSIGETPLERFQKNFPPANARMAQSREWLEEKFLNRITRKVRKDSTIFIDKVQYDVPMELISRNVTVFYLPDDMDHCFILYGGKHYELRKTNKVDNAHTKRNNLPALDYSRIGEDKKDESVSRNGDPGTDSTAAAEGKGAC